MKKTLLIMAGALAMFMASCGNKTGEENNAEGTEANAETTEEVSYTVDGAASSVVWKGEMLGIKFHEGTIGIQEGQMSLAGNVVTGGSFTIDMASINPTDENYTEEQTAEKLVGHLVSPDFFATDSFPTASFVIKSVSGDKATGEMTIRGITAEETVEGITVTEENGVTTVAGKLTFDRKKYGVSWDPAAEVVLSDNVPLNISLVLSKS